jgi:hypothetical protein
MRTDFRSSEYTSGRPCERWFFPYEFNSERLGGAEMQIPHREEGSERQSETSTDGNPVGAGALLFGKMLGGPTCLADT